MPIGDREQKDRMEFLSNTFPRLQNLRPGTWHITKLGNRNTMKTSSFAQYEHLDYLNRLTAYDRKLAASMDNDYMVAPDVVVYRDTVSDEEINEAQVFVDCIDALIEGKRLKDISDLPMDLAI